MRHLRTAALVVGALWVGPPAVHASDVDGTWDIAYQTDGGPRTGTLVVATDGEAATATMEETALAGTYRDGLLELSGEHYAAEAGYTATVTLKARLEGEKLAGEWAWAEYSSVFTGTRPSEQD